MKAKTTEIINLLREIDEARRRMSAKNPHRALLHRCGNAIIELGQRAEATEVQHLMPPAEEPSAAL